MKQRFQFLFLYFSFWVVFFIAARFIFLTYHIEDTKQLTLETIFGIFANGIRMDFSMAGYLSIIPFALVAFSNFLKKSKLENYIFSYTFVGVFFITLIIVIDLQVFNTWGYRLDATPLKYLKSPIEAWASVSSSPLVQLFISFIVLLIIASYIVYRIITKNIDNWNHISHLPFMPLAIACLVFLVLPIRGSLGISPMNQSTVYFSNNNFANIAAVNAPWNFMSSIVNGTFDKVNPYTYLPKETLTNAINSLFQEEGKTEVLLEKKEKPLNVILLVWESFTKKATLEVIDKQEVTPNFNRLKQEGVYFSEIYASGDRTDKGLPAILSAYPAQPIASIINTPNKSAKLPVLSKDFGKLKYTTSFYYGGDLDFANLKSYLFEADFQRIISKDDFDSKFWNSKWGAHDAFVYDKFIHDHAEQTRPFFSTILTLSSHEPFEIPMDSKFVGNDEKSQFMNAMNYADAALGKFIEEAKKQTWWENTLIVVVADHGHRIPKSNSKVDDFAIPMLWLGGAVKNHQGLAVNGVGSQIDLAATLLNQLKMDAKYYPWSKNLLNKSSKKWAFFTFNNGFGYIEAKNKYFIYDNTGHRMIESVGNIRPSQQELGKALMQKTFQDYLDK